MGFLDRKLLEEIPGVRGDSGYTDAIGFLVKAGQGDQTSLGGWCRMRTLIRYQGWSNLAKSI